jgi:hypothetical protein
MYSINPKPILILFTLMTFLTSLAQFRGGGVTFAYLETLISLFSI